jgi:hypothetical protein
MTSNGYKQNEISQELSMGTKIFKTSYYTVLRAFLLKKIKILMTVPLSIIGKMQFRLVIFIRLVFCDFPLY